MENNNSHRQNVSASPTFAFGGLTQSPEGPFEIHSTDLIRRTNFAGFGWALRLNDNHAHTEWQEILFVPPLPDTPGAAPESCSRGGPISREDTVIGQLWGLSDEDRDGSYHLKILIDNVVVHTVTFSVTA